MKNEAIDRLISLINQEISDSNYNDDWRAATAEDCYDYLIESDIIEDKEVFKSRWWVEYSNIVAVGDTFWRFNTASTTTDYSASEAGYETKYEEIHEVRPVEVVTTEYISV